MIYVFKPTCLRTRSTRRSHRCFRTETHRSDSPRSDHLTSRSIRRARCSLVLTVGSPRPRSRAVSKKARTCITETCTFADGRTTTSTTVELVGGEAWAVRNASLERLGGVRDCPRFRSCAPTRQPRRRKGMSAIPEHGLSDAKHKEIKGILPAAVRRSKQPAIA